MKSNFMSNFCFIVSILNFVAAGWAFGGDNTASGIIWCIAGGLWMSSHIIWSK